MTFPGFHETLRLGIVSDSHGASGNLAQAIHEMGPIALLLHAGDGCREAERWRDESGGRMEWVGGNCDFGAYPEEQVFPMAGHRLLLTHGHLYGVKTGLLRLGYRAAEMQADVVVFGHTHEALNTVHQGVTLINPGSLSSSRCHGWPSYAVLRLGPRTVEAEICRLGQGPVLLVE